MKASSARRAVGASNMSLRDLWNIANEWCPRKAAWTNLLDYWDSWGPSHEIGHALIEPRKRRNKDSYGRCAPGFCEHEDDECDVFEVAAMMISRRLVTVAGHPNLANREVNDTNDYDLIATPRNFRRARALLKRKKLWPVPRTKAALERALQQRCGRRIPVAKRRKRAKRTPFAPLSMFANLLSQGYP